LNNLAQSKATAKNSQYDPLVTGSPYWDCKSRKEHPLWTLNARLCRRP